MNLIDAPTEKITTNLCVRRAKNILVMQSSIVQVGLLHPIGINKDYELIYGRTRLEVCRNLGWETIPAIVLDSNPVLAYTAQKHENDARTQMTPEERVQLGKWCEEAYWKQFEEEKEEREALMARLEAEYAERKGNKKKLTVKSNDNCRRKNFSPKPKGMKVNEMVAKQAGFGNRITYEQAKSVVEKGTPELKEAMNRGDVSISAAANLTKLPEEEQKALDYSDRKSLVNKAKQVRESRNNDSLKKLIKIIKKLSVDELSLLEQKIQAIRAEKDCSVIG